MKKTRQNRRQLIMLVLFLMFSTVSVLGQSKFKINGTVYDENDTELPGVNVVVDGSSVGTVTDFDGNFALDVLDSDILIFSYLGFETKSVPVEGQSKLTIRLMPDFQQLEDVVVVGYGKQSRAKVTSSISKVDDQELKNIPSVSPAQALQGKMAGVSVPVLTGQPGENHNIVIRGGTTYSPYATTETGGGRQASDPLYVIDGVFRSIGDVNPDDIESIQVMKDAASTAIYGARGANGVIIVTTKTGNSGSKPKITFRYQHGIETQARNFEYLSARQYIETFRPVKLRGIDNYDPQVFLQSAGSTGVPIFNNPGEYGQFKFTTASLSNLIDVEGQAYVDNLLANGWETMPDPVDASTTLIFKDSHYQDVVWNTANTSNYNLGVSGGSEVVDYNVSLGYVNQGGVFLGTNYERFSGLANIGLKVNDKLRLNLNTTYLWNDNQNSESTQNDITRGTRIPPLNRLYNDDGLPNLGESNNPRNRLHQLYYQDYNRNTNLFLLVTEEIPIYWKLIYYNNPKQYLTYFQKVQHLYPHQRQKLFPITN